ncbi:MAG: 3,4-dihydroxy-2-butanone-4-phosphate synthase [Burkholderiaceae bacterium]|nr:3,4-dihydroxy-2-butanone-4-phosphate synthase [Burkholderiaceae bacterium]
MHTTTEEVIDDICQERMVVLVDDKDHENEGDIVIATPVVTAWTIRACPATFTHFDLTKGEFLGIQHNHPDR